MSFRAVPPNWLSFGIKIVGALNVLSLPGIKAWVLDAITAAVKTAMEEPNKIVVNMAGEDEAEKAAELAKAVDPAKKSQPVVPLKQVKEQTPKPMTIVMFVFVAGRAQCVQNLQRPRESDLGGGSQFGENRCDWNHRRVLQADGRRRVVQGWTLRKKRKKTVLCCLFESTVFCCVF